MDVSLLPDALKDHLGGYWMKLPYNPCSNAVEGYRNVEDDRYVELMKQGDRFLLYQYHEQPRLPHPYLVELDGGFIIGVEHGYELR